MMIIDPMPIKPILQLGNPLLVQKCRAVDDVRSDEIGEVIADLDCTLSAFHTEHGFGRAIAAPQIGHLWRVVFVRMSPGGFEGALINPRIVSESSERIILWDDCL
jgi:peptide deformylase